ncbi:MAG: type II toxin-antitoxin system YafQ family toxin [Isosphaeraceae bacterium]
MAAGPPPLVVVTTSRFDKDAKRDRKRGKDMDALLAVVDALRHRRPLEARHRDHALAGPWKGWRECHVEPDWLLIYRVDDDASELILARTGRHSDLFE